MEQAFDAAALEQLAIDTFARVKGDSPHLGVRGTLGVDLEIVPGNARAELGGVFMTVRLIAWDGPSINDIKEQEVALVPAGLDDARLVAFFEGIGLGLRRLVDSGAAVETYMPADFVPFHAVRDPALRTAEAFAAHVGAKQSDDPIVFDATGSAPIAQDLDLERAIDDDPDRVESFLVYADWLTQQGDPRGELIACSVPDAPVAAKRRAGDILAQHRRYFLGSMPESELLWDCLDWSFALGYFDQIRLRASHEIYEAHPKFVEQALGMIMALPSSRFIRGITFGCLDYGEGCRFQTLYPILVAAGARPSMRSLFIGDTESEEQELSWTDAGDLSALDGLYPNLRRLRVHTGHMQLGDLAYPKLESLVIQTGGLAAENVHAIAAATLPRLAELELWFGRPDYGATSSLDDIAPILAGDRLPAVKRLALRNCEWTDELCVALAGARILPRVTQLDLSMGTMSDAGVAALLAAKSQFAHLTSIDVTDNYLTDDGLHALGTLGVEIVNTRVQRTTYDGEDRRYAAVGE